MLDYQSLIHKLYSNIPFSMTRRGDGERLPVFGCDIDHYNGNGSKYYPEMGEALKKILSKPVKYYLGLQNLGYKMFKEQIDTNYPNIEWFDADILHCESIDGDLRTMFNILNEKDVILIGPEHIKSMDKWFKYKEFITVDTNNCWLEKDKIEEELELLLKDEPKVVLLCAGQTANVIVDDLFDKYGDKHTFIDIGSLFEPYVGTCNRQYHRGILDKIEKWNSQ